MSKSMVNFTKGIVAGVVVGAAVGLAVNGLSKPAHPFAGMRVKKKAGKIAKNIGAAVSNVTDIMR